MPFDPSYLHLVFPGKQFEAYLYGRASRDPNKRGDSVEDQLAAGRLLCHTHNWAIVEEFKDTGLSATRHAKRARDDFEELLVTIEVTPPTPGVTRILVAFEASRYYRDLEAYVRLRAACQGAGVLLCYKGTVYDLSRSDDRKATAMDAIAAESEGDDIRDRNLRTAARTAEAGDPHGARIFGYRRDYEVVNGQLKCVAQYEDEATGHYVYDALVHIDSGKSMNTLIKWLNAEPEAERLNGNDWTAHNIRLMLLNRAYLGERKNHGAWRKASWKAIKGLETPEGRALFNRVTAILTEPDRVTHRGSEVAHLLSHIAYCGECGDHALLVGDPAAKSSPVVRCRTRNTSIRERWLDAYVEEAVIDWFRDKKKSLAALVPDDTDVNDKMETAQRRVIAFQEQLDKARTLANQFDDDTGQFKLSAESLADMERRLLPQLEAERKKVREITGTSPLLLSLLQAADPDKMWNGTPAKDGRPGTRGLTLEQKREVIKQVVTIRLWKARSPGVRRIEDGRVTLAFVGEPGFRGRPLRAPESAPSALRPADAASGTE
jgi:DNA invertase Pin-like site-specific DNA recombinase